MQKVQA